jgi:hypothetical protein
MRKLQLFLLCLLLPATAFSYARPLHRRITTAAIALAAQHNDFLDRIGTTSVATFGTSDTVDKLAADGADQEDALLRSLNHFFDAANRTSLKTPSHVCFTFGERADLWAIDGSGNQWSFSDARAWLSTAIVGLSPNQRNIGYRNLFTNLGHGVHLIQDMAQPEHTRNDQHLVGSITPTGDCTPGSLYETWTLHHLTDTYPREMLSDAASYFTGTTVVRFNSYSDYFSNSQNEGMADLTNRNFVTQDTNYGDEAGSAGPSGRCATFTQPSLADATERTEAVTETILTSPFGAGTEVTVDELVYCYPVRDAYNERQVADAYHTHRSSIDHEIHSVSSSDPAQGGDGVYSLSNHSYNSRARILLPRAVEYSAGLIDHFFRGRVAVTWAQNAASTWNMTIVNSSGEPIGADARVIAIYKATPQYFNHSGAEDAQLILNAPVATYAPGFNGLSPGDSVTLSDIPVSGLHTGDSLMQFERRIVVIATLGSEPDVVIPEVQGSLGMRVRVDASPAVVAASVSCSASNPTGFRQFDVPVGTDTPFAIADNEQCRALIQHQQQPVIDNEGTPTTIRLRVWRGSQVVEDLSASIDAGDVAVGGCHRASSDGHCDRFIQRTGHCVFDKDYQGNTKCETTTEQWDWGTGPY